MTRTRRSMIFVWLCMLGSVLFLHGTENVKLDGLEKKVPSYMTKDSNIIEALKEMKLAAGLKRFVVTLEVAPFSTLPEKNLSINLHDTTIRGILESIISKDPRYTYSMVGSNLVHIYPIRAKEDPKDLLNLKIRHVQISNIPYDVLLSRPDLYISDLRMEIMRRSRVGGYLGSVLGGGPTVKRLSLDLREVTVRDVLNYVSEQSLELHEPEGRPTGWVYTFRVDKSVPMGGYPSWGSFGINY